MGFNSGFKGLITPDWWTDPFQPRRLDQAVTVRTFIRHSSDRALAGAYVDTNFCHFLSHLWRLSVKYLKKKKKKKDPFRTAKVTSRTWANDRSE